MAITVNSTNSLSLLNILNKTQTRQTKVLEQMSTGNMINRGADNPAGMLALTKLDGEIIAVNAGITNNQRTDAVLGVADNALNEIGNLVDEIQRLANETANDAALTADEISANQAQIDDALSSIDRIVANTNFNGRKLLDGSLGIRSEISGAADSLTDIRVYSREAGNSNVTVEVTHVTAASSARAASVMSTSATEDTTFTVQGNLGTAVIEALSTENVSSVAAKINSAKAQTGVSAVMAGNFMHLYSVEKGAEQFVRTTVIDGDAVNVTEKNDTGADAVVTVNGQATAVDGEHVTYNGNGVSMAFELGSLAAGSTVGVRVIGDANGTSGATFQLGTNEFTRATIGVGGMYTHQLGNRTDGYLASLRSGGANSLLNDAAQAGKIARKAALQVSTLQGRIGGFQKFQVRTSLNSLNDNLEGLQKARGVINDVDFAKASSDLNRENILMQSGMSLLGLANQQAAQVLQLLG